MGIDSPFKTGPIHTLIMHADPPNMGGVAHRVRTGNGQSHVPRDAEATREWYSTLANIDWTTRGPATRTTIPVTTGYSLDPWSKRVQCSGTSAEKACQPGQPLRQTRPAVSESIFILLHEDDLRPRQPSAPARSSRQRDQLGKVNACCAVAARHRRTQFAARRSDLRRRMHHRPLRQAAAVRAAVRIGESGSAGQPPTKAAMPTRRSVLLFSEQEIRGGSVNSVFLSALQYFQQS